MKYTAFYQKSTLNLGGHINTLSNPMIMAILNLTPDSFYSESRVSEDKILAKVEKLLHEGADIIDIGGYSSRPGAADISEEIERKRVIEAIKLILSHFPNTIISIDTFRSKIAKEAVEAGAQIINDISGGEGDKNMFDVVADLQVPYILMHMRGTPKSMQSLTNYEDIIGELLSYFEQKIHSLKSKGVKDIILDPGFGFAKSITQNFYLLKNLEVFNSLSYPVLVGLSRKSFIYKSLEVDVNDALNGSIIANTLALSNGASILRVHDVKETKELVNLFTFMRNEN